MSPPVFSDIPHSGISFQNEGEVNSPLGGTVLLVQSHYIFFRFTCQEIVRPPPHFSAIVHEPRLQNLSKKSIKSLLSETLFHRMRFQIFPPLHAFRGMEMDAVGGQFFSQAIVLHGHGLRHIQIQALLFSRRFLQKCVIYCNKDSPRGQAGSRVGGWDFSGPVSTGSSGSSTCAATGASRTGTCGVSSGTAEAGGLPDSRTQNAPSASPHPQMTPAAAAARFLTHLFHGNTSPTVSFTY